LASIRSSATSVDGDATQLFQWNEWPDSGTSESVEVHSAAKMLRRIIIDRIVQWKVVQVFIGVGVEEFCIERQLMGHPIQVEKRTLHHRINAPHR
jgi:hypothetical protein